MKNWKLREEDYSKVNNWDTTKNEENDEGARSIEWMKLRENKSEYIAIKDI